MCRLACDTVIIQAISLFRVLFWANETIIKMMNDIFLHMIMISDNSLFIITIGPNYGYINS